MEPLDSIPLRQVWRGDATAWRTFVAAAGPLMRGVIWRVLSRAGRGEDCADVLQEAFVRLLRDDFALLRRYDPQRAGLGTWLGVVASSCAIDWLRKAPAHETLERAPAQALAADEPKDYDAPLRLPPGLIPPRQALILKLIYEDDLDVAEVAALLGIEAQTVRSLRHKAIGRLRQWLKCERRRG